MQSEETRNVYNDLRKQLQLYNEAHMNDTIPSVKKEIRLKIKELQERLRDLKRKNVDTNDRN